MKKTLTCVVVAILIISSVAVFAGCDMFKGQTQIHWEYDGKSDGRGLEVGETLGTSCPAVRKDGYEFLGWFDSQTGGNMWVDANGKGVKTAEKKGESYTLYPHFEPLEFVVQLNVEKGVQGLNESFYTVKYDDDMPVLPSDLKLSHKKFIGYFTEANGGGTQVTRGGTYLPNMNKLTHSVYNIDDNIRTLNLYAYFEDEIYTVTFHFGNGYEDESLYVPYGTPLNTLIYETRDSQGFAMTKWSDSEHGSEYIDSIRGDIDLYAIGEWAPAIWCDSNGGNYDYLIVGKAGSTLSMPTPQKTAAQFVRWLDEDGNEYNATFFPENSIKVTASWKAMIEFDSNGGTRVNNICVDSGTPIELPIPTRDGYIFAGWYPENNIGQQYSTNVMPVDGVKLKAGWCKPKNLIGITWGDDGKEYTTDLWLTYTFKDGTYINNGVTYCSFHFEFECNHYSSRVPIIGFDGFNNVTFGVYSEESTNKKFELMEPVLFKHEKVTSWRKYTVDVKLQATSNKIYILFEQSTNNNSAHIRNITASAVLPDLTTFVV